MNLREVTIGRSDNCDIYLDPRCQYASSMHGTIYYDGNQLMFRDTSSNGTMINNIRVHKRAIPINRGDVIMIAGKYPISWNQIDSFFPNTSAMRPTGTVVDTGVVISQQASSVAPPNLAKWSWGAFSLGWIWGVFNGCWWMIFAQLGVVILNVLMLLVPFGFIVSSLVGLGMAILFGVKGSEWAWKNRSWASVADFEQTQSTWNKVGMILFFVGVILVFLYVLVVLVFISSSVY